MADDVLNNRELLEELGLDPEDLRIYTSDETAPEAEKTKEEIPVQVKTGTGKKKAPGKKKNKPRSMLRTIVVGAAKLAVIALSLVLTLSMLFGIALMSGDAGAASGTVTSGVSIMDKFDMFVTNEIAGALDGILSIKKVYWLSDSDMVAPKPNPANYGTADSPSELNWLIEEAADLIGDQKLVFNEDTPVWQGDKIYYYYDETILVITWKQNIDWGMYTLSEVRIAHPSQFRRFLAGGEFGSDKQYVTTEMAASVNAVVATSGDFYKHRLNGVIVYDRQVRRFAGKHIDTCYINDDGDLLFTYRKQLANREEAEQFVADNNVRFSLAFGPVLVDNGVACPHKTYTLGEVDGRYARAALCQVDKLHYLLVSAGGEAECSRRPTIQEFAQVIEGFGVQKAYALDGGQTTAIAMDGQLINHVEFGYQRAISDIIYFATALPDGE